MATQFDKGKSFRALHARAGAFIIPNPWNAGTVRLLEHAGFEALATTSAGYAFSAGRADGSVARGEMIGHIEDIVSATCLPVSADLENGYGDDPDTIAATIRLAATAGAVGGSIEDFAGPHAERPLYDIGLAAERISAAAEAARVLPFPFTLTARAENYLAGKPDLRDTIARLQAYQEAGADVLYAPGITAEADIAAVVASVDRPVNVVVGVRGAQLNLARLAALGVKRVSVGSALSRVALGALLRAVGEMREQGSFAFSDEAAGYGDLNCLFEECTSNKAVLRHAQALRAAY